MIAAGRDPAFLPKEIFNQIMELQDSKAKMRSRRVSRHWKQELEEKPAMWRDFELTRSGLLMSFFDLTRNPLRPLIGLKFFSDKSYNTPTSSSVVFEATGDHKEHLQIFEVLKQSSNSLKTLSFRGDLNQTRAIDLALDLASSCSHPQTFEYLVKENSINKKVKSLTLKLSDYQFKSYPSTVRLSRTRITSLDLSDLEKCDIFRGVKYLTLDWDSVDIDHYEEHSLGQRLVVDLLKRTSQTLLGLVISQRALLDDIRWFDEDVISWTPLDLPNPRLPKILFSKYQEEEWKGIHGAPVTLITPLMFFEDFECANESFVLEEDDEGLYI